MALRWDRVDGGELIARFLTDERDEFNPTTMQVKRGAFRPPHSLRYSVFRISNDALDGKIPDRETWGLARQHVEPTRGKVLARAELSAADVVGLGLQVEPDGTPHPRHANIVGWPSKDEQMKLRQALATKARLVLCP